MSALAGFSHALVDEADGRTETSMIQTEHSVVSGCFRNWSTYATESRQHSDFVLGGHEGSEKSIR